jgi:hypothetical protein
MKKLNYFIVSNEFISTTEPIEESLRERNQSLKKTDEFRTDFWVINSKDIIKNDYNLYNFFKNSIIFKKLQSIFYSKFSNLDSKNFTIIFTTNKIFIDWINLKIPNLELNKNLFTNKIFKISQSNIENIIGISGLGNFNKELIKKDEIWLNSKYFI